MDNTRTILIALLLIATLLPADAAAQEAKPAFGLVISAPAVDDHGDGTSSVTVGLLAQGQKMTVSTEATDKAHVAALTADLVEGNLVDFLLLDSDTGAAVAVPENPTNTFHLVLEKGDPERTPAQFDSMKYGPELSPINGQAGPMVAAGWVYAKSRSGNGRTITVGDGRVVLGDISGRSLPAPEKRYEEMYPVHEAVDVYNVNTSDYSLSGVSDFESIPVTADYEYATTSRQTAYFVFDKNYTQADEAKVIAIYYFTPQSISDGKPVWDVPTQSYLLRAKGSVPASESATYAGQDYSDILASGVSDHPYARSTEPFEIVKGTFYYVGDNEVAVYLFDADMGTPDDPSDDRLIMLDAGWPNSGYQYWKNIEAVGFNPREITDWLSTHGHRDHYGTAVELFTMIENAGGTIRVFGTQEDTFGLSKDAMGNEWDITGALPASETVIREKTVPYKYDQWYDFGNVKILVTPTPGHTTGTGSFVFKIDNPDTNEWVTFGYMGGYGYNGLYKPTPSNGWLRLNFQLGLSWLQQMVDVDYVAPQHTNQYPIVEVYQALKAYNNDPANAERQLTMLDALMSRMADSPDSTTTEFVNFCEKRYSVATNARSDISDSRYSSIETTGPFKPGRENGLTNVRVTLKDGGKIVQGFNSFQNKNLRISLLKDGIQIAKDSYTHDPDGWYVQFYIDVLDDATYQGYVPEGHRQEALVYNGVDRDGEVGPVAVEAIDYRGGPVESLHAAEGTPEVLRTQRLESKADAEAILSTVVKGETYTVSLTKASAIVVPSDVRATFASIP